MITVENKANIRRENFLIGLNFYQSRQIIYGIVQNSARRSRTEVSKLAHIYFEYGWQRTLACLYDTSKKYILVTHVIRSRTALLRDDYEESLFSERLDQIYILS